MLSKALAIHSKTTSRHYKEEIKIETQEKSKDKFVRFVVKKVGMPPEVVAVKDEDKYDYIGKVIGDIYDTIDLPHDPSISISCDDCGLLKKLPVNIILPEREEFLAGDIVFSAYDETTGETVDMTDKQIEKAVKYSLRNCCKGLDYQQALIYSKAINDYQKFEKSNFRKEKQKDNDIVL